MRRPSVLGLAHVQSCVQAGVTDEAPTSALAEATAVWGVAKAGVEPAVSVVAAVVRPRPAAAMLGSVEAGVRVKLRLSFCANNQAN